MGYIIVPVFSLWEEFFDWLLDHTEKFPKKSRFTFALRIETLAIEILQDIVKAKYSKEKLGYLENINLNLNVLRVLLRSCNKRGLLSHRSYEFAITKIDETGRMIGGWLKSKQ